MDLRLLLQGLCGAVVKDSKWITLKKQILKAYIGILELRLKGNTRP